MTQPLTRRDRIAEILKRELAPSALEIQDDSARHAHHAGAKALGSPGETHFNIAITSAKFDGLNRIARHRLVNGLLAGEFETGLHALSLVLHGETTL
ncbi:BolA family transcriptional regulator [Gluconobacter oxydans]|uniref:BolA family protein n=1 Tax=Gluconobacter thailandicus TaxID=257438 RepID=UPI000299604D|nr:BolA family protein [Gluconobacter thailandicus]AFW02031.1 BolA protein [Gluconobacter oxydans H24]ANQ42401.1 BolA family transcriptional regulator [Gluconobacter oxydans]